MPSAHPRQPARHGRSGAVDRRVRRIPPQIGRPHTPFRSGGPRSCPQKDEENHLLELTEVEATRHLHLSQLYADKDDTIAG